MKVLLIEDDAKLAHFLEENLKDQGFVPKVASNQFEIEAALRDSAKIDLVLMDRLLGSFDSKDMLHEIKAKWPEVPLMILSAINTPNERSELLNSGADDYLGKPFSTRELTARIRALLRRTSTPIGNYTQVGNLVLDSIQRTIAVGDKTETLSAREFSLLRALTNDPVRLWKKEQLLEYVWGHSNDVETNVVEATITNVRKKLEDIGANISIRNMRNAGYWIKK